MSNGSYCPNCCPQQNQVDDSGVWILEQSPQRHLLHRRSGLRLADVAERLP